MTSWAVTIEHPNYHGIAMKVLFQPDYPDQEFYTIVPVFQRLGYFATLDPTDRFEFAMAWQDRTWTDACPGLEAISADKPVLNLRCRDISKRHVERIFSQVFGYSTFVDPLHYQGRCVEKHDENAIGGVIVECPLSSVDPRFVHQRLIDARQGDRTIEYRVPVVLNSVPLVYLQHKDIPEHRIKTATRQAHVAEVADLFRSDEIERILEFSRLLGMDFGELDILRDKDDGKIYILDANKTPGGFGMRNRMNWEAAARSTAIERLAEAFDSGIRNHLVGRANSGLYGGEDTF